MNTVQHIDTIATIKTTNMLIKCPKCDQLICGYAPLVHNLFCNSNIENGEIRPTESGDTKHNSVRRG